MLELNEKKIRKGKPVGLPYQGSKKKISKKIVEIIKQNFGTEKPVYDIFGGGGAITAECLLNGLEVHYNDLDETATSMFRKIVSEDRDYLKTLLVSRDEFFKIREKENKTIDDELKLLINSFGNNRKNYLYSKKNSDLKYNIAIDVVKNHNTFKGYLKTKTYIDAVNNIKDKETLKQLVRIQQLACIQQLERVQNININNLEITNRDYIHFSYLSDVIIYLDPPYEKAHLRGYSINNFDSKAFYDWAYEMSKKNIVLISSYEISDERFECVYEFKTVKSTFAPNKKSGDRTEKLFMVKKGEE